MSNWSHYPVSSISTTSLAVQNNLCWTHRDVCVLAADVQNLAPGNDISELACVGLGISSQRREVRQPDDEGNGTASYHLAAHKICPSRLGLPNSYWCSGEKSTSEVDKSFNLATRNREQLRLRPWEREEQTLV